MEIQKKEDRLSKIYWDLQMEEPVDLEEFCERVRAGQYGPVTVEEIAAFLRRVEIAILGNIESKLEESPHVSHLRDEKIAETEAMIADLLAKYAQE